MKIIAINRSPRGQARNILLMVESILQEAGDTGAETINILSQERGFSNEQ